MQKYLDLLKLSREVISSRFNSKEPKISEEIKKRYSKKQASFVTLTKGRELRGCIGSIEAHQELWEDVISNSIYAAFSDPRFNPVCQEELSKIKIEISVLSEPKKLGVGNEVFDKINSKMGLILKKGRYSATFLPQVWEQIPDKKEFLEHLSRKAGLLKDSWKDSELWYYTVESVKE